MSKDLVKNIKTVEDVRVEGGERLKWLDCLLLAREMGALYGQPLGSKVLLGRARNNVSNLHDAQHPR
jgi:hypothetical protein